MLGEKKVIRVAILYNVAMFSRYSESLYTVTLLSDTIKGQLLILQLPSLISAVHTG